MNSQRKQINVQDSDPLIIKYIDSPSSFYAAFGTRKLSK